MIGAIDIYDDFALVDVPIQYKEQVLEGMPGATIRSRETSIRLATVHDVALRQARRRVGIGTKRRASSSPLRKKSDTRKGKKSRSFSRKAILTEQYRGSIRAMATI